VIYTVNGCECNTIFVIINSAFIAPALVRYKYVYSCYEGFDFYLKLEAVLGQHRIRHLKQ